MLNECHVGYQLHFKLNKVLIMIMQEKEKEKEEQIIIRKNFINL